LKQDKKTRIPVEAVVIIIWMFSGIEGHASTGSSWSREPSWANSDSSSGTSSRRTTRSRDLGGSGDISPFSPGSNNLAIDLGQVFLMGDLTKYSDSIGTQLHYTYGVSDLLAFDSSLGYSQHSNGQFSMASLLTGIRLNMSWYDKIIPYAIFGLGFYRPSYQDNTGSPAPATNSLTDKGGGPSNVSAILFGLDLGPGIDLELSHNMFFGAAVTFHNMFGTTQTWANGTPLDVGGTYTSFFLQVGATF